MWRLFCLCIYIAAKSRDHITRLSYATLKKKRQNKFDSNNFCFSFAILGDDLLEFHQAVVSTLRDADDGPIPLDPAPLPPNIPPTNPLMTHTSEDMARLSEIHGDLGSDQNDDEADNGKK